MARGRPHKYLEYINIKSISRRRCRRLAQGLLPVAPEVCWQLPSCFDAFL